MTGRPHSEPDWVVVGCGLTGATFARQLAELGGQKVLIVDHREHIAGNVYDELDSAGVRVQRYGAHIFHTSSTPVWEFLSRFTDWYPYQHRVLAQVDGRTVPIPFNFTSLQTLLPAEAIRLADALRAEFPGQARVPVAALLSAADADVRWLGEFITDKVFRHYTAKQWGRPIEEVDPSVLSRVPVTLSHEDGYFRDRYQAIPADGYTALVARLLDHPAITVQTGVDGRAALDALPRSQVFWTGPLDEFFDREFGALDYRSLRFEHQHVAGWRTQPAAVINYPGAEAYTRVIEHTHFGAQPTRSSTLTFEFPSKYRPGENEPYYPVLDDRNRALQERYLAAAAELDGRVLFGGRLGDFRYYDMHQAVARALGLAESVLSRRPAPALV
jgi:UDP-galactopyranose mutase